MGKLTGLLDRFNSFTGRNSRHNRALRDVTDLSVAIQEFMSRYNLQEESSKLNFIFENIGSAKFDLTTIAHRTRMIIKTAKDIKGKGISPLIEEVHSDLEDVRRALINPALGSTILSEVLSKLRESFKKLHDAISDIEYK